MSRSSAAPAAGYGRSVDFWALGCLAFEMMTGDAGDAEAALVLEAMVYQIAKEAGAMVVVLQGRVDATLLTGGMAWSDRVVKLLRGYIEWIAPITVYPGEDELQALAEGVFRVLNSEEQAKRMGS